MELKKYIKRIFKPSVAKRAKAMKNAKRARNRAAGEAERKTLENLEKNLGYSFKNKSILRQALTHPGVVGTSKEDIKSNQRLEFLGDSVLQSVITDTVFRKFDELDEGALTKIRIALTQGVFLSELSSHLTIPNYLILPKGSDHLRTMASAAEDAFEAVVGAIYLDSSFEEARKTVLSWYKRKLEDLPGLVQSQNPKGALQEMAAKRGDLVSYALISQSGPDHQKVFEVEVLISGKSYARATASSKKAAESKSAKVALRDYSKLNVEEKKLETVEQSPSVVVKKKARASAKVSEKSVESVAESPKE